MENYRVTFYFARNHSRYIKSTRIVEYYKVMQLCSLRAMNKQKKRPLSLSLSLSSVHLITLAKLSGRDSNLLTQSADSCESQVSFRNLSLFPVAHGFDLTSRRNRVSRHFVHLKGKLVQPRARSLALSYVGERIARNQFAVSILARRFRPS